MDERDDRSEHAVPRADSGGGDTARREITRIRVGEAVPDRDMPMLPLEGTARVDTRPRHERFDSEHTIVDPFVPADLLPPLEGHAEALPPTPASREHDAEVAYFDDEQETNLIERSVLDDETDRTSAAPPHVERPSRTATELAPRLAPAPIAVVPSAGAPARSVRLGDNGRRASGSGDRPEPPDPTGTRASMRLSEREGVSDRVVRLPLQGGESERTPVGAGGHALDPLTRSRTPVPPRPPRAARLPGVADPVIPPIPPPRASAPVIPPESRLVGGRYRILQRIGEGGMGKVLKVEHAQLGKTFALKIISEDLAGKQKARESFYREARLASSLSHPNVATVVDFGEDPNLGAFMVMELLEGEELSRLLRREKQLGVKQALEIIEQVAEALHYIHGSGIIHCDIKTDNILLVEVPGTQRRKKQVKLLDFGLARSMNASRQTVKLSGTPQYVAPERIRGSRASPSADIYGLGILLYELITGSVPFDGTIEHILGAHLEMAPRPPSELVSGLESGVETLILRALEKQPEDRHKDMAAFLYELRTVMDMLGYGRKRGGGKRIVVGRGTSRRGDMARAVFDANRVPMAVFDRDGTIVLANAAFAKFVMGVAISVEGLKAQSTALASTWGTFESDLQRACQGTSVQRILEVDIAPGKSRRLLIWLDPSVRPDQAVFGVHPLEI